MKCSEHDDLTAFLDGELDQRRAGEIRAHIAECPRCREEIALLKRSWEALDYLEAAEPPAGFAARVRSRARRGRLIPLAAAAAVLLAGGLFYLAWRTHTAGIPENGPELARLSAEERQVIENMDLLENYEILSDLELLVRYRTLEELEEFPEVEALFENGAET